MAESVRRECRSRETSKSVTYVSIISSDTFEGELSVLSACGGGRVILAQARRGKGARRGNVAQAQIMIRMRGVKK
jgi:ribosomal protein S5